MDWERTKLSLDIIVVKWSGRLRTLLRAVAIAAVALGGFNLLIYSGIEKLTFYRGWLISVNPAFSAPYASEFALFVGGLVTVLVLSIW